MKRLEYATVVTVCATFIGLALVARSCTISANQELTKRQAIAGTNPPVMQVLEAVP